MNFRSLTLLAALSSIGCFSSTVQAQGFVFGTAQSPAKPETATLAGVRNAKVETAQRLLARLGLLRETPSGLLTPPPRTRFAPSPAKMAWRPPTR